MVRKVMHFNSLKERLDYLRGGFEEIVPTEVKEVEAEEKEKPKKAKKKGKKDDKVQTE